MCIPADGVVSFPSVSDPYFCVVLFERVHHAIAELISKNAAVSMLSACALPGTSRAYRLVWRRVRQELTPDDSESDEDHRCEPVSNDDVDREPGVGVVQSKTDSSVTAAQKARADVSATKAEPTLNPMIPSPHSPTQLHELRFGLAA